MKLFQDKSQKNYFIFDSPKNESNIQKKFNFGIQEYSKNVKMVKKTDLNLYTRQNKTDLNFTTRQNTEESEYNINQAPILNSRNLKGLLQKNQNQTIKEQNTQYNQKYSGFSYDYIQSSKVLNSDYKNKVFTEQFFFKQKSELGQKKLRNVLLTSKFKERCQDFFSSVSKNSKQQFPKLGEKQAVYNIPQANQIYFVKEIQNKQNNESYIQSSLISTNPEREFNIKKWNQQQNLLEKKWQIKTDVQSERNLKLQKIQKNCNIYNDNSEMHKIQILQKQGHKYHSKTFLFLRHEYFDICTSKNSLSFCYHQIQFSQYYEKEKQIINQFRNFILEVAEKLKFQSDKLYVYLKDGTTINLHIDIPEDTTCLIISVSPCFKGLQNQVKNRKRFLQILQEIESPLTSQSQLPDQIAKNSEKIPTMNIIESETNIGQNAQRISMKTTFEKQVSSKFKHVINSIIEILNVQKKDKEDQEDESEYEDYNDNFNIDSSAWEKLYKILNKNQKENIHKFLSQENSNKKVFAKQWDYKNNQDYLKSNQILIKTKKIQDMQDIVDYYDEDMKSIQFQQIESTTEDNAVVNRILKRKNPIPRIIKDDTIKQVASNMDLFKKPAKHQFDILKKKQNHHSKKYEEEIFVLQKEGKKEEDHKKKPKKQISEQKKYQITKIIARYMSEFLSDMEKQKKSQTQIIKEMEQKMLEDYEDNDASLSDDDNHHSFEINFQEQDNQQYFYQSQNIKAVQTKKGIKQAVNKLNKELWRLNINKIMLGIPKLQSSQGTQTNQLSNFTRFDIHNIYIIYQTLHLVTSQRYKNNYKIEDGLDFYVYRQGLYQIFMQSEEIAKRIFNTIDYNNSGFMDWNEFLKLMIIIRAKTLAQKINLFIQIADQNGDGELDWGEIKELASICLQKYLPCSSESDKDFVDKLCEYFTKLIFETVEIKYEYIEGEEVPDGTIPFSAIKNTIIEGKKADSNLLCMFCGADI